MTKKYWNFHTDQPTHKRQIDVPVYNEKIVSFHDLAENFLDRYEVDDVIVDHDNQTITLKTLLGYEKQDALTWEDMQKAREAWKEAGEQVINYLCRPWDPKPQPTDGPDYHQEIAAWKERNPND